MEKRKLHIVSLSGGKDSTAMLLRMLEEGMPVDIILFCDTGLEFEAMYRHIDKLERYIGRPITRLKSDKSFEYLFFDHMPKRKNPELEGRHGYYIKSGRAGNDVKVNFYRQNFEARKKRA